MNLVNKFREVVQYIKDEVKTDREIASKKRIAKLSGLGYINRHIGNTIDGNYPIFLADDFVYVQTRLKDVPSAMTLILKDGTKEIYINNKFLGLSRDHQAAIIQHEVGHIATNSIYTRVDTYLSIFGLSNKTYRCECAADDYAVARGFKIKEVLIMLRDTYKLESKELNKRIARLS